MPSDPVLDVRGLCKHFKLFASPLHRILEMFAGVNRHRDFTALSDISFTLARGEFIGVIGENGSGKSTLLKLLMGVLLQDSGTIARSGRIAGVLELGAGFNPQLSGRQNIYLNGVYLGMTRAQLRMLEPEIIDFAELADFIDQPLRSYSSGMAMRLAFAIAIHADPACFIIDEALSVGDIRFQQKCFGRLRQFRETGGSVLFVSHDLNAVRLLCDRVIVLDRGRMRYLGDPEEAVNLLNELLAARGSSGQLADGYGSGEIRFKNVRVLDGSGRAARILQCGAPMRVSFSFACARPVNDVTFGLLIRDRLGQDAFGTNGFYLHRQPSITADGWGSFVFPAMNLGPGVYTVNMAAHSGASHLENCYHWLDRAAEFELVCGNDSFFVGHTYLAPELELGMAGAGIAVESEAGGKHGKI